MAEGQIPSGTYPTSSHCRLCGGLAPSYIPMRYFGFPGPPPGYLETVDCQNCGGRFGLSFAANHAIGDRDYEQSRHYAMAVHKWLVKQPRTEEEIPEVRWERNRIVMSCADVTQELVMPMGKNEMHTRIMSLEAEVAELKRLFQRQD